MKQAYTHQRGQSRAWIMVVAMAAIIGLSIWAGGRKQADDGRKHIVCTFLPVYVFAQNVIGNDPDITIDLLIPSNVGCPHSFSLRSRDVELIDHADAVLAIGLDAEHFLEKMIEQNREIPVLTISDDCDLLPADPEAEHANVHAHDAAEGHDEHDAEDVSEEPGIKYNTHAWVSPTQAAIQVNTLAQKLSLQFPEKAQQFQANADRYIDKLKALASDFDQAAETFTYRNIATFHPSFDYLAKDLDLHVVATLTSTPGYTPPASELRHTIEQILKHDVRAIFVEPAYRESNKLADAIISETNAKQYSLNPFNTFAGEITADSYERTMRENLATLTKALKPSEDQP